MRALAALSRFVGNTFAYWVLFFAVLAFLLPQWFVDLKVAIVPLLGLVMFGMGLALKLEDFAEVGRHPGRVVLGVIAQFVIMPGVAWLLCQVFSLPPEIAVGVILVGCCPSGTSSNVMTWLARGDLALAVSLSAITTLLAPLLTPALIWLLSHSMYRVEHRNLDAIPDEGAALLVCNHVSFVDALLIGGAVRRPIRFVMYYKIYNLPVLNFIFRTAGTIPIAGRQEDIHIYESAFTRIAQYLQNGELVCIFPEGKLTADGEINEFKGGLTRILQETPVPVIPLALQGLWGSFFSRDPNKGLFRRLWSRVTLVAGPAVAVEVAEPAKLQALVGELRGAVR